MITRLLILLVSVLVFTSTSGLASGLPQSIAQTPRTFPETGKTVTGRFLTYWNNNGGVAQQGFPISDEIQEVSQTDGKTYTVQYFERAVFEYHPENEPPYDVLLSLLGVFYYNQKYARVAPQQSPNTGAGSRLFPETGKRLGGAFLEYWNAHGGVAQQGYPISEEFRERSDLDGKTYTVQYFERAVFEYHPENVAPYDVLLSQLGLFSYRARHGSGDATNPAGAGCDVSGNKDGKAEPARARTGEQVRIHAWGFQPAEPLSTWITRPDGDVMGIADPTLIAPQDGAFYYDLSTSAAETPPGRYMMTWEGLNSGHQSVIYFCVLP